MINNQKAMYEFINKTYTKTQQKKLSEACKEHLSLCCAGCPAEDDCNAVNRLYVKPINNGKSIGTFYLQYL